MVLLCYLGLWRLIIMRIDKFNLALNLTGFLQSNNKTIGYKVFYSDSVNCMYIVKNDKILSTVDANVDLMSLGDFVLEAVISCLKVKE